MAASAPSSPPVASDDNTTLGDGREALQGSGGMDAGVRVAIITSVTVLVSLAILIVAAYFFVRSLRRLSETQQEASLKRAVSGDVPRSLPRTRTGRLQLGLARVGTGGRLQMGTTTGPLPSNDRPSNPTAADENRQTGKMGGPPLPKRRSSLGLRIGSTARVTGPYGGALRTWRDDGVSDGNENDVPESGRGASASVACEPAL